MLISETLHMFDYFVSDLHLKCALAALSQLSALLQDFLHMSHELFLRAARVWESNKVGVPDPLDLCQPCWELVLSVLKRWRQLHPCQEGHGITQTFGKQGGAQGSWQPHRDQHTNATTPTSLLFLEEYKKQSPLCLPVKAQILAFDPRNLASISTRADPLAATGTPTLPQHVMAGGAGGAAGAAEHSPW